jgi:hypothetical protein
MSADSDRVAGKQEDLVDIQSPDSSVSISLDGISQI